jgi:hypothetical protein
MNSSEFIQEALSNGGLAWFNAATGKEARDLLWELLDHPSYEGSSDAYDRSERPGFWFYDVWGTLDGQEWSGKICYPKN